jgi:replication fork protection complex subunit Tof1/Swi1
MHYDRASILRTVVRTSLASIAMPRSERSARDDAIIRIVLYFLRNIIMISQPARLPSEGDDAEISRATTIEVLNDQDIFPVILTIASSIGEEFPFQDMVVLEILFHLLKGVDVETLFMKDETVSTVQLKEFQDLRQKEKALLAGYARTAPSRHNRFGTMVWMKREDDKVTTISGQDVFGQIQRSMEKMDQSKKWNKPKFRGRTKDEREQVLLWTPF